MSEQHKHPQQQTHLRHVRCNNTRLFAPIEKKKIPHLVKCLFCPSYVTFLCPFCRTHCNSQVLSQKQLCDERLAAAKLEYEMKLLKPATAQVRLFSPSTRSESRKRSENPTLSTCESDGVPLRSYTHHCHDMFLFQENAPGATAKKDALETVKITTAASTMTNLSEPQVKEGAEILTNEITVGKIEDIKGLWSHELPHKKTQRRQLPLTSHRADFKSF